MRLLFLLILICVACVGVAWGADSGKPYRVAMVLWRGVTDAERGFMDYLTESGMDVDFIVRDVAKDKSLLPGVITEIKGMRPDLVYTFGTTVTRAVAGSFDAVDPERNITDIPIVFNIVADPVGAELLGDSRLSGRNLTGTSHLVPIDVQLKALLRVADYRKIGVVYNPLEKNSKSTLVRLEGACGKLGIELVEAPVEISSSGKPLAASLPGSVQSLIKQNVDLIYLPSDSFVISHAAELVEYANNFAVPTFSTTEGPIRKDGAFMGVVSRYYNVGKFAGHKAKQILSDGVTPGEIPVETLKRFTVLVNMGTARKLDFYPPVSVLRMAEVVKR